MNIELLEKIKHHIQEVPARYTFDWVDSSNETPCGTKACIAGWAMVLSGKRTPEELRTENWHSRDAAEVLDLDPDQEGRLFIRWPDQFSRQLRDAENAVQRIDYFIATGGTDQEPT